MFSHYWTASVNGAAMFPAGTIFAVDTSNILRTTT